MPVCPDLPFPQLIEALCLLASIALLLATIITYGCCFKSRLNLAFSLVMGLFANEFLAALFRILPYVWCYLAEQGADVVCAVAAAVATFFQIAAGEKISECRAVDVLHRQDGLQGVDAARQDGQPPELPDQSSTVGV